MFLGLYWRWIAGLVLIFALVGQEMVYGEHRYRQGVAATVAADARVLAMKEKTDTVAISQEGKEYAKAVSTAIAGAPIISVCIDPPRPVLPRPARRSPDAPAIVRSPDPSVPTKPREWDTRTVVQIGHDADAQIAGLQDYIERVCRNSKQGDRK